MIGMVLVTHGGLAREFLAVLEHVVGPQKQAAFVLARVSAGERPQAS